MPRKNYDPLAAIPSPEVVRERLSQTLELAEKFRILLEVAERLRLAANAADKLPPRPAPSTTQPKGGSRG
jgi:hypothetical protein